MYVIGGSQTQVRICLNSLVWKGVSKCMSKSTLYWWLNFSFESIRTSKRQKYPSQRFQAYGLPTSGVDDTAPTSFGSGCSGPRQALSIGLATRTPEIALRCKLQTISNAMKRMKCINNVSSCFPALQSRNQLFPTNKSSPTGLRTKQSYPTSNLANLTTQ